MGLFIGEYIFAFGTAPSLDAVLQRLSGRTGLDVRRRGYSSFEGSHGFVLSRLGEGASLKPTPEGWYVEYDQFPPSVFLLAHLDATFRELGGMGKRDGSIPPAQPPLVPWQLLPWWEKLVYRSTLIRFLALLCGPLLQRIFAKRKAR